MSSDFGSTWTELPPLIPDNEAPRCYALKAGAVAVDSTITAAYIGYNLGSVLRGGGVLQLKVVQRSGREVLRPQSLGSFRLELEDQAPPQVVCAGASIYIVFTFNEAHRRADPRTPGGKSWINWQTGDLIAYRSADAGRTWSGPLRMIKGRTTAHNVGPISKVVCVQAGDRVQVAFRADTRLYLTSVDSVAWNQPVTVPGVSTAIVDVDAPDCFAYGQSGNLAMLGWTDVSREPQEPSLGILGGPLKLTPYFAYATVIGDSLAVGAHMALSTLGARIPSLVLAVRKDTCMVFWAGRAAQPSRDRPSNEKPYIDYFTVPMLAKQDSHP